MTQIALQRRISDVVDEYVAKKGAIKDNIEIFEQAKKDLESASVIGGTFGESLKLNSVSSYQMEKSLLISAWRNVYEGLNIKSISSASDRKKFEQMLGGQLPEFNLDNIRDTFGDYILSPRQNILRGFAEVFCSLDPFYKSHSKVAVGVKGLPKRIIISSVNSFYGWGAEKLTDVINALATYERKPMVNRWIEVRELIQNGEITSVLDNNKKPIDYGVKLVVYKNGNGHLHFNENAQKIINKALAEYYGDVLPDAPEKDPKKQESTEVSKDLQYYPTPKSVVERVVSGIYHLEGKSILEPSCGCGRFLDVLKAKGAIVDGIEYDLERVNQCKSKGHNVLYANFLETVPIAKYDLVIMNPPFYGKHYAKHVNHALKFLKAGGVLKAVLPITARYDHGLLKGKWEDLPVGSFSESGTNINTTILTITK